MVVYQLCEITLTAPLIMEFILWELEVQLLACPEDIAVHSVMVIEELNLLAQQSLVNYPARFIMTVCL